MDSHRWFFFSFVLFVSISSACLAAAANDSFAYAKAGSDVEFQWDPSQDDGPRWLHSFVRFIPDYVYNSSNKIKSGDPEFHLAAIFRTNSKDKRIAEEFHFETAPSYNHRVEFIKLTANLAHFVLKNVSQKDAGAYVCDDGWSLPEEWVPKCGQTLVIVETPVNVSVTVEGNVVAGQDVKLRCSATSLSVPRPKLMHFRWFEYLHGHNNTKEGWTELAGGDKKEFFELMETDDEDVGTNGSGWGETNVTKGQHSEPLHEVLEIGSLSMKDDGRRIKCSATEGFDLWSDDSPELVLSLESKPTHSDLVLVPNVTHTTLTVGDSIDVICMATCRPACTVTWEKVLVGNNTVTLKQSSTLSLHHVSHHSHGFYRCRGSNLHGSAHVHWKLFVKKAEKPWFSEKSHVITVVALATGILALGMTGTAVAVLRCRNRSSPIVWTCQRKRSDTAPLSTEERSGSNTVVSYF